MSNFEILQCPPLDGIEQTVQYCVKNIENKTALLESGREHLNTREFLSSTLLCSLACRHLVGRFPLSSQMLAQIGSGICVDYLTSTWWQRFPEAKNQVRKKRGNSDLEWFQMFRQGMIFASLVNERGALEALGNWTEPWLELDSYPYSPDPLYGKLYLLVARHYRSARAWDANPLQEELKKSRKKGPKLLYQLWEAVLAKDQQEFGRFVSESVQQFEKTLGEIRSYEDSLDLDTSMIVALARQEGLQLPKLEARLAARLMTTESLGL